ncbi:hypothetical protein [Methylobacterium sp. J-070]|uniref:hypothetical protein n=1 Tax=Methylobacterium sp. J-070 TaxID=2836650 RepID=UPI001FBA510D|nr:hypothetical protein [Methylobacterium sp. J-070]MCJ2053560.1 hypothetical protein [Methylobacterium sp. J-070]
MATKPLNALVISAENEAAINEALAALRGRAKVFPDATEILYRAKTLEDRLADAGVAASNRVGCLYSYREAGPTANAYKYCKTVIEFALKRSAKGWTVTHAGNTDVYSKQGKVDRIDLTPKAKEAVLRAAMEGFGKVRSPAPKAT